MGSGLKAVKEFLGLCVGTEDQRLLCGSRERWVCAQATDQGSSLPWESDIRELERKGKDAFTFAVRHHSLPREN